MMYLSLLGIALLGWILGSLETMENENKDEAIWTYAHVLRLIDICELFEIGFVFAQPRRPWKEKEWKQESPHVTGLRLHEDFCGRQREWCNLLPWSPRHRRLQRNTAIS